MFVERWDGGYNRQKVVGFGEDRMVNGHKVKGVPYVNLFGDPDRASDNPNNYLFDKEYRVAG